jgi:hypothetical protein
MFNCRRPTDRRLSLQPMCSFRAVMASGRRTKKEHLWLTMDFRPRRLEQEEIWIQL